MCRFKKFEHQVIDVSVSSFKSDLYRRHSFLRRKAYTSFILGNPIRQTKIMRGYTE